MRSTEALKNKSAAIFNRQRKRRIDRDLFAQAASFLLQEALQLESWEVAIHLVGNREMARLNWQFLQHSGPTDVITFDYRESSWLPGKKIAGEIFICVPQAELQAREFSTTWESELLRYLIHGVLHLLGYDDLEPNQRRVMKQRENQLLKSLERRFRLR